ncbi:hypothetical protein [Rhodoblastus sp.]|uniref:hypothetical protein n=1 Tax=Rhodoblastus sp. TaxID=1962975 RepID=UPI003F948755
MMNMMLGLLSSAAAALDVGNADAAARTASFPPNDQIFLRKAITTSRFLLSLCAVSFYFVSTEGRRE